MEASDEHSRSFATLEESLSRDSDIEFVVAFGSQVTGDSRSLSDLDLAVKSADDLSSHERFQKRCFPLGDHQQADAPFIDLSDIGDLPLSVTHDTVNGDFLCGNEQAFHQIKTDIEASFEERRDEIRRHQQDVIDRIAEDGFRG